MVKVYLNISQEAFAGLEKEASQNSTTPSGFLATMLEKRYASQVQNIDAAVEEALTRAQEWVDSVKADPDLNFPLTTRELLGDLLNREPYLDFTSSDAATIGRRFAQKIQKHAVPQLEAWRDEETKRVYARAGVNATVYRVIGLPVIKTDPSEQKRRFRLKSK